MLCLNLYPSQCEVQFLNFSVGRDFGFGLVWFWGWFFCLFAFTSYLSSRPQSNLYSPTSQNCFVESHQIPCWIHVYFSPLILYPQILFLPLWKRLISVNQLWFWQLHVILANVLKISIRFINQPFLLLKQNFSVSNFWSLSISFMGKSRFNVFTLNLTHYVMQICHAVKPAFTNPMY